jgi:hypothetical protein
MILYIGPLPSDSSTGGFSYGLPANAKITLHSDFVSIGEEEWKGMNFVTETGYHLWSGDHARTFYVPHRSGGGARRPGNSSRVYLGQNLSDSRMITHFFRNKLCAHPQKTCCKIAAEFFRLDAREATSCCKRICTMTQCSIWQLTFL